MKKSNIEKSMLLRRITDHVKAQNWTAVALDFFIVVIGGFIRIQVRTGMTRAPNAHRKRCILSSWRRISTL